MPLFNPCRERCQAAELFEAVGPECQRAELLGKAGMQENGMLARGQYAFEDLQVGMSAELLRTVMESDVVAFARLSGDDNPIHLSEAFAAATPFGGGPAPRPFTGRPLFAPRG